MSSNYPNPLNPETFIAYELPIAGSIRLEVYNVLGQKIRTLVAQDQVAGVHRAAWDGNNDFSEAVASGLYLYRLEAVNFKATKRMVLIR